MRNHLLTVFPEAGHLLAQGTMMQLLQQWTDLRYLAGFIAIFVLLVILLVLRTVVPAAEINAPRPKPANNQDAPETAPPASSELQRTPSAGVITPPINEETNPFMGEDQGPHRPGPAEAEELEGEDPEAAAHLWGRLGRWARAARLYEKAGNLHRAMEVWRGLNHKERALAVARRSFAASPGNEELRLALVEMLLDEDLEKEALELVTAVSEENGPLAASGRFLASVGRSLEARGRFDRSMGLYRKALARDQALPELEQRLLFLKQYVRLSQSADNGTPSPAREFLDRALESTVAPKPSPEALSDSWVALEEPALHDLPPHEIIVGHLAFGFQKHEPQHRAASVFSLSRRFTITRQLSDTENCCTFEAQDRLLDYTVALKLYRLPQDFQGLDVLRERLRAIAMLNHPNLAKLTFVDRNGPMLRIATEFLSGGNLRDFLENLGGAGLPLLVRMAMSLASVLHTSHLRGVPHGDIRPENIHIGPDQRIKVMDYAIAAIPVYHLDQRVTKATDTGLESGPTPSLLDSMGKNEGVQNDLLQIADVLEFMLAHSRHSQEPLGEPGQDPQADLNELVKRLRGGEFTSVLRLWQVLEQILRRTMPAGIPTDSAPRLRT